MMLILVISWISLALLFGNIRHLSRGNKVSYTIRMTLYFLPYSVPAILFLSLSVDINLLDLIGCVVALLVYMIWLCLNYKSIKTSLTKEIIARSPKIPKYTIFFRIFNSLGAAICEELFFRAFILSIAAPIVVLIILSTVLFTLSHYLLPWSSGFIKEDYINQTVIGFVCAVMFVVTGSIISCILLHLLMNTPTIIKELRCFDRHYIRKNKYDEITNRQVSMDELAI